MRSITKAQVKDWANSALSISGKQVSSSRIRQAVFLLRILLNHAVDMELLNRSVLESINGVIPKLNPASKRLTLEEDQLDLLATECGDYRSLILIAGYLGLRWAEVIALLPQDFDFEENHIHVCKTMSEVNGRFLEVPTKSGLSRTVPIPDFLQVELKERVLSTSGSNPVFSSKKGNYLRSSNFARRVFIPALSRAGLPRITFHDLRHTAISHLIERGADVVSVSKIAGHSSPATTLRIYAHERDRSNENIKEAINRGRRLSKSNRNLTAEEFRSA